MKNTDTWWLSNLSKVAELISDRAGILILKVVLLTPVLYHKSSREPYELGPIIAIL